MGRGRTCATGSSRSSVDARARPYATLAIVALTTLFMVAQAIAPDVLESLRRAPGALAHGEYWRLITPALVHSGGWPHYAVNVAALLVVGIALERRIGAARLIAIYVGGSVVGEIVGLAWKPHGAGASVGIAGLAGALVAVTSARSRRPVRLVAAGGVVVVVVVSVIARDVHGLPMLTGAVLGALVSGSSSPESG